MVIQGRCLECGCIAMGLPLVVDPILALLRFFKEKINWGVQKETVIVCENKKCIETFKKRISSFHREIAVFVTTGIVLGLVIIGLTRTLQSVVVGVIIALICSSFSLAKYCPNVEGKFNA